jgi:DNA-binding MarR family transcriptional regulator
MNNLEEIQSRNASLYARLLIGRARHLMLNARQKELAPYHISSRQAYILYILYNLGHKATLTQIAADSDRAINTVSLQMTRMEKDGLVKKVRETPKSTLIHFELTEKGIDIYNQSKDMKVNKAIMSALSKEENAQLIAILKKIISKAAKYQ